jgi:hypothetical protein
MTDTKPRDSIDADFVEIPAVAGPYLTLAAFLDVPDAGWQRVLDVYTDYVTDCVVAVCGDPTTAQYDRYYRTFYSETEHVICAVDRLPKEVLREHHEALVAADELVAQFTRDADFDRLRNGLPSEAVEIEGSSWERVDGGEHRYEWVHALDADQYDWDPEQADVTCVDYDTPVRMVSLEIRDAEWRVTALETTGPDGFQPGLAEPIGSDFTAKGTDAEAALETIEQYLELLS